MHGSYVADTFVPPNAHSPDGIATSLKELVEKIDADKQVVEAQINSLREASEVSKPQEPVRYRSSPTASNSKAVFKEATPSTQKRWSKPANVDPIINKVVPVKDTIPSTSPGVPKESTVSTMGTKMYVDTHKILGLSDADFLKIPVSTMMSWYGVDAVSCPDLCGAILVQCTVIMCI